MKVTKNILPFEAHQLKKQKEKKEKKSKGWYVIICISLF